MTDLYQGSWKQNTFEMISQREMISFIGEKGGSRVVEWLRRRT